MTVDPELHDYVNKGSATTERKRIRFQKKATGRAGLVNGIWMTRTGQFVAKVLQVGRVRRTCQLALTACKFLFREGPCYVHW